MKVLEELLTPEDLPAMRSVLRFMYTEVSARCKSTLVWKY